MINISLFSKIQILNEILRQDRFISKRTLRLLDIMSVKEWQYKLMMMLFTHYLLVTKS